MATFVEPLDGNWLQESIFTRNFSAYLTNILASADETVLLPHGKPIFLLGAQGRSSRPSASIPLGSTMVIERFHEKNIFFETDPE